MRRLTLCLCALLAFAALPATATAGFMYSPEPATADPTTAYSTSLPIDIAFGGLPIDKEVRFTYVSGGSASPGNAWTLTLAGLATRNTFTTSTLDPVGGSYGAVTAITTSGGATGTSLPEGTYDVTASYTDMGDFVTYPAGSSSGVVIDRTSLTPDVTAPSPGAVRNGPFTVSYNLAEAASSASLVFTATGQSARTVALASGYRSSGSHSLTIDPTDLTLGAHVSGTPTGLTLPDGSWQVSLQVRDALINPTSSDTASFVLDTFTWAPVITSPASGSSHTGATLEVDLALAENPLPSSVSLTFMAPGVSRTLTLQAAEAGTHTLTIDRAALALSGGVASVAGGSTLPDGTYTMTLGYQDAAGNERSEAFVDGVVLATTTPETTPGPPANEPPTVAEDPATETEPPLTLTPRVAAKLSARFTTRPAGKRRVVSASFKTVQSARRYRLTATRGGQLRAGRCTTKRGIVTCAVTVTKGGAWKITAAALDGRSVVLAGATRTLR